MTAAVMMNRYVNASLLIVNRNCPFFHNPCIKTTAIPGLEFNPNCSLGDNIFSRFCVFYV